MKEQLIKIGKEIITLLICFVIAVIATSLMCGFVYMLTL